jgi:hypothetical protein
VYKIDYTQSTISSTKSSKRRSDKKYIHEIVVDQMKRTSDLK